MDVSRSLNCRELKECDVIDSDGDKVGRISDMTFTFDGELKLSQFILAGSTWEEFLESIGAKPDMDPVFDGSLIKSLGDKIQLNTSSNSLKSTLDKDAIPTGEIRLSTLENMDILDDKGVKVGRAVDIDFDVDGNVSLTVGGGFIEETLESFGFKKDVDIIVPGSTISVITDSIQLRVSRDSLGLTMDKALKAPDVDKAKTKYTDKKSVMKVRLFHKAI
ncbi:MAG: PRC-barrel domain-containing protein [Candidatus Thorarchaeota archaeon]|nr:PRC-barrel domain-containing protein [Candidatus Thorarchaeota archaeon]